MTTYSEFRPQIKSGDLLIWETRRVKTWRDFQLKLVQIFTQSSYDHVGIAWVVGDRVFVIEATPPEVRIYPLSKLLPCNIISMDITWQPAYDEYLLSKVGEKYSLLEAIRSYMGKPKEDDHWQCAEFTSDFYKQIGVSDQLGYTPRLVIDNLLQLHNKAMKTIREDPKV